MKGDFVNDDFMVRQKREVDVLFAGGGADDFGLVWDGYQVDSWFVLGQGLQNALNAPTLFYSVRIWKAVFWDVQILFMVAQWTKTSFNERSISFFDNRLVWF